MMRRMLVASAAVLGLAIAAPQTADAQSVYLLAGLSIPSSDLGDVAGTGWLAAGGVTFPIAENGLWAGAEGLYGRNGSDSDTADFSWKTFSVMGLLGYDIPTESNISPYVWGGAGLQTLKPGDADSESGFGFQFGAGIAFEGESNLTPFLEGRYQSASINDGTSAFLGIEGGVSIGLGSNAE